MVRTGDRREVRIGDDRGYKRDRRGDRGLEKKAFVSRINP
jgi:hypothetical protein